MKANEKILLLISITAITVGMIWLFVDMGTASNSNDLQITDMMGNTVEIPNNVDKVASISASSTVILYMLAPDKMIGWNEKRSYEENQYMQSQYKNLPVIGGGKNDANYENIISLNPDVVFIGHGGTIDAVNEIQQKFGDVPTLDVEGDNNLSSITPAISFVGKVLGEEQKANHLIELYDSLMQEVNSTVANIPENEKKKVYYARDSSGLMSNPPGSSHTQLIEICGGDNVVEAPITKGSVGVSMELILKWNPDIIITSDPSFYKKVYDDPLWQNVKAVQDQQVYLVPQSPFNWFEGPPGANTILGIAWTAKVIYPEKFQDMDLKNITKEFYADYYHYNLTDAEVSDILSSSGLKDY